MIDAFQISDSIAARINAGEYSMPVSAQVKIPRTDRLEDILELQVTVLPVSLDSEPLSRDGDTETISVSIGIQKKTETKEDAEVRSLHRLVREIQKQVNRHNVIVGSDCAAWQSGTISPIFSASHLIQNGVFSSVIDLTYEVET